jgi:hypothetical protein
VTSFQKKPLNPKNRTFHSSGFVLGAMLEEWNETFTDFPAQRREFAVFLAQLRAVEPPFAQASVLQPDEIGEWHAAVYLLTGCGSVWEALGSAITAQVSIAPVREELESLGRPWSPGQRVAMEWALHFWRPDLYPASFPAFRGFLFTRWIVAAHLRKGLVPAIRLERL